VTRNFRGKKDRLDFAKKLSECWVLGLHCLGNAWPSRLVFRDTFKDARPCSHTGRSLSKKKKRRGEDKRRKEKKFPGGEAWEKKRKTLIFGHEAPQGSG